MDSNDIFIGLMSGTSLDGVDAALVDFSSGLPQCIATAYLPYPDDLKADILALSVPGDNEIARLAHLSQRLAREYAQTVRTVLSGSGCPAQRVRAIGCHGQTLRHEPAQGYTLQANHPSLLAELTGLTVIADFRSRDLAAGGQGAPLVPAFHEAIFRTPDRHRIILNIGGIANLTNLSPGHPTGGFDCGPGNMLLDAWITHCLGRGYDEAGQWGATGQVLPDLLTRLSRHIFFNTPPPKSCGREQFNLAWLQSLLCGSEAPEDVQATLLALTVFGIGHAIDQECNSRPPDELFVCGGGVHNHTLMEALAHRLPTTHVTTTDTLGLPADWVEAVAFAWLARQTLRGQSGNLPAVTGARGPRVLGTISLANSGIHRQA
ncbi:MAG: anhydro-N-acetylmuramic acid kinase [Rhodocyclaceae bacterium]|nr:anhydro-N-acetylmuramic acid kinase [Rhodocyclaceae bacterium]